MGERTIVPRVERRRDARPMAVGLAILDRAPDPRDGPLSGRDMTDVCILIAAVSLAVLVGILSTGLSHAGLAPSFTTVSASLEH